MTREPAQRGQQQAVAAPWQSRPCETSTTAPHNARSTEVTTWVVTAHRGDQARDKGTGGTAPKTSTHLPGETCQTCLMDRGSRRNRGRPAGKGKKPSPQSLHTTPSLPVLSQIKTQAPLLVVFSHHFKFQLCNHTPPRTQKLWFSRSCPAHHGNNATTSPLSITSVSYTHLTLPTSLRV